MVKFLNSKFKFFLHKVTWFDKKENTLKVLKIS